jgi:osmotically-inducible protein OsmY
MNRLKNRIKYELVNNGITDNQNIQVNVIGHKVKLHGMVDSHFHSEEASRLAWNSPEVWSVENELVVGFSN